MSLSPGAILPRDFDQRTFGVWARSQKAAPHHDVRTFTPTWGGFSADPVGDVSYIDLGALVILIPGSGVGLSGTSNATSFTLGAIPEEIRPTANVLTNTVCIGAAGGGVSGSFSSGAVCGAEITTAGGINFYVSVNSSPGVNGVEAFESSKWANSGAKGWLGTLWYPLT